MTAPKVNPRMAKDTSVCEVAPILRTRGIVQPSVSEQLFLKSNILQSTSSRISHQCQL
jgi:hypothetical protein